MSTQSVQPSPQPPPAKETLQKIGITNPETIPTKQAAAYLTLIKGVPTAPSSVLSTF